MDVSWLMDGFRWGASTVVGAGIAGHFIKKKFDHQFDKQLASYKFSLDKELAKHNVQLTKQIENLKAELQIKNNKEQTKYNGLHEERRGIIKEFNTKLVELNLLVSGLLGLDNTIDESLSKEEAGKKYYDLVQKMNGFYQFHEAQKIYLSSDTNGIFNTFITTLQIIAGDFYMYYIVGGVKKDEINLEQNITKRFRDEKRSLEKEFSKLLGVTEKL